MRQETLLTGRSGQLRGRLWIGDEEPSGVLMVVHGLGDHAGRYETFSKHVSQTGWSVFAFDLPGHGVSPGRRGNADSFKGLLADIEAARNTLAARLPAARQVLMGHSMGGNLALNYVLRQHHFGSSIPSLGGLMLCAPMLLPPTPPPRPHIFAAWLTGHLFPWIRIDRPVDPHSLTRDPEEAEIIANDPLLHSRITVYLATQLLSQGRWALDHARSVDLPTVIMLGESDPLIDRSACEHLAIRIGERASLVRLPEMRHDLFHDIGKEDVIEKIKLWLTQLDHS